MTAVALVHDYLTQRGGAERVVLNMARAFPGAPLYTSLYEPASCFPEYRDLTVRPLGINETALLRRHHRLAFPVLAWAFACATVDADVTLVSSSGWAHGIRTTGRKVVYCHAPARWLYQSRRYLTKRGPVARMALSAARHSLETWDRAAARSADRYLVNSTFTQRQVREVYGIEAEVLHPPHRMDVGAVQQQVAGVAPGYLLCVARLQAYKNVDVVVQALQDLPAHRLVVVGTGPLLGRLRAMAGPNVVFVQDASDAQLRWLYANATLLVGASYEDFGLTPVEAAAFGIPAVTLRFGGYLDTVAEDRTGVFFDEPTRGAVGAAVRAALARSWDDDAIRVHAERFAEGSFIRALQAVVATEDRPTQMATT